MSEFPIPPYYEVDHRHHALLNVLKRVGVVYPWHRYLIAIDGVDGVGKSTLGRYLSWQLGMPVIPIDEFFAQVEGNPLAIRDDHLAAYVGARLNADRPVIVEGVFALKVLNAIGLNPDFLIRVIHKLKDGTYKEMSEGPLADEQIKYAVDFATFTPTFIFETTEEEVDRREFPKKYE